MRLPAAVVWAAAFAAASVFPFGRAGAEAPHDAAQDPSTDAKAGASRDQDELARLRRQVEELSLRLDAAEAAAPRTRADPILAQEGSPDASGTGSPPPQTAPPAPKEMKLVSFYGHLDLSVDAATKGLEGRNQDGTSGPTGHMGWQPAISTNASFVGVRGGLALGGSRQHLVYQLETQVDVSATPGYANTNFYQDSRVAGALVSRNSFVGLAGGWGAVKLGKSDTPYYTATRRMDPFFGTPGASTSIMGNTGGDNRVEFGYRMSHAAWYESPRWGGLSFAALVSPGQNRNDDNLIQPAGEPNCTGYYVPGTNNPLCNDGAFGTGWSAAVSYDHGPVYATAAWELHQDVNRTVDEAVNGGASPTGSIGITNEYAWKVGAEYTFPTHTTVGAVYEQLVRQNPYRSQDYNERDRFGTWLEIVQKLSKADEAYLGWAHAGKTPGDVGTHRADGSTAAGPVDNQSNMFAAGFRHRLLEQSTIYVVYAVQANHDGAHFDLGAGSHGIQYDCHDAGPNAPNSINAGVGGPNDSNFPFPFGGGRCFAGGTLQAASVGMTFNF